MQETERPDCSPQLPRGRIKDVHHVTLPVICQQLWGAQLLVRRQSAGKRLQRRRRLGMALHSDCSWVGGSATVRGGGEEGDGDSGGEEDGA